MAASTSTPVLAVGLNKGFTIKKRKKATRPSNRKGVRGAKAKLAKEVIREVAGFSPYERRMLELLRIGLDKRTLRFAKRRLGTHHRGKKKREEMNEVLRLARTKKE